MVECAWGKGHVDKIDTFISQNTVIFKETPELLFII